MEPRNLCFDDERVLKAHGIFRGLEGSRSFYSWHRRKSVGNY